MSAQPPVGPDEAAAMLPPPDFAALVDWTEDRLPEHERAMMDRRIQVADPGTVATVIWLREFVETSRQLRTEQPPPTVRRWLNERYAEWWTERTRPLHEVVDLDEALAELIFDSRQSLGLVGVRGVTREDIVHLAFSLGGADVVVDLVPAGPDVVHVEGQLLTEDPVDGADLDPEISGEVELSAAERFLGRSALDHLGRFRFEDVRGSHLRLRVRAGHRSWILDIGSAQILE